MNRQQRRAAERQGSARPGGSSPANLLFAQAAQAQRAGRTGEAEQLHRQVLALEPRHADSLHLLGVLYLQADRPQDAADLIGRAIAIDGRQAQFHNNLGSARRALGQQDAAVASFRRAIELRPDYPRALMRAIRSGCCAWATSRPISRASDRAFSRPRAAGA